MISMKNLIAAPVRLQRILLWLQQYAMTITYRPGKEMFLADTLSHLPSQTDTQIKLDLRVNAIAISAFTRSCLTKIAAETQWDPILSTVNRLTLNGWPARHTNVPRIARNYWDFRDELSIKDDLLMKDEWVIIPPSCRHYHGWSPQKPHRNQQGIGLGKNVCLLARNGSWCDRLYQEVPDMHWEQ